MCSFEFNFCFVPHFYPISHGKKLTILNEKKYPLNTVTPNYTHPPPPSNHTPILLPNLLLPPSVVQIFKVDDEDNDVNED